MDLPAGSVFAFGNGHDLFDLLFARFFASELYGIANRTQSLRRATHVFCPIISSRAVSGLRDFLRLESVLA